MNAYVVNISRGAPFDVYCGRASSCPEWFDGDGANGYYGNPFVMGRTHRAEAIERYKHYFTDLVTTDAEFLRRVLGLDGKVLGCWCAPLPCHVSEVIVPFLRSWIDGKA